MTERRAAPPDIVIVGHVTVDETPDGPRPGGAAAYASLVAARFGLRATLVTCAGPGLDCVDILPGVEISLAATGCTTTLVHSYADGRRIQHLRRRAEPLSADAIPAALRGARMALLGPVIHEIDPAVAADFPRALIGAAAQGWLRRVGADGLVEEGQVDALDVDALAGRLTLLCLSEEDLAGRPLPDEWLDVFPIVVVTLGRAGLRVHAGDRWWRLPAFPAVARDPTGAGDALAAAMLIRYAETGDVAAAVRFGAATASFVVEAPGLAGVPSRAAVERRLTEHPEIRLDPEG